MFDEIVKSEKLGTTGKIREEEEKKFSMRMIWKLRESLYHLRNSILVRSQF